MDLTSALRFTAHEVQLGRVIHSVCRDPVVADAFVAAALEKRERPTGVTASAPVVPAGLRCIDEDRLFAVDTAIRSRGRRKELGRVDLVFKAPPSFRLHVELKLDANFGPEQIERYARAKQPVLAIVRNPHHALAQVTPAAGSRWLGACAWEVIVDDLRRLPISDPPTRELWRGLIEVINQSGDFNSTGRPRQQVSDASVQMLERIRPDLAQWLTGRLGSKYSREQAARLRWDAAYPARRWAVLDLRSDSEYPLRIELRDAESTAPVVRLTWITALSRRRAHRLHEKVVNNRELSWTTTENGVQTDRIPLPVAEEEPVERHLLRELRRHIDWLIRCGVFDEDMHA